MLMKTNNYNVIGDVAGNYLTLLALLDKMPKDADLICAGDPNDRGPRTKEVIEFLMKNGNTVNSNHAHMMVEEYNQKTNPGMFSRYYDHDLWPECNGGKSTIKSYLPNGSDTDLELWYRHIPQDHIDWLNHCPMFIETPSFVITHAPCRQKGTLEEMSDIGTGFANNTLVDNNSETCLLWNRFVPKRHNPELNGKINIFGHNSYNEVRVFNKQYPDGIKIAIEETWREVLKGEPWAIGIDTSFARILTGLHLPTMTIYQQEYID